MLERWQPSHLPTYTAEELAERRRKRKEKRKKRKQRGLARCRQGGDHLQQRSVSREQPREQQQQRVTTFMAGPVLDPDAAVAVINDASGSCEAAGGPAISANPIDATNKGHQLLHGMGWQEGMGLGSNAQGRTDPIAVIQRKKRMGLGHHVAQPAS